MHGAAIRGMVIGLSAMTLVAIGCQTTERTSNAQPRIIGSSRESRAAPEYIDVDRIKTRDDIVSVHQFWAQVPWLSNSSGRAVGFQVPVFFVSGETEKGAFVSGRIMAWLYELAYVEDGKLERELLHMWEFDQEQAGNYRVRKEAITGYYYGFMLSWPLDIDVSGRLVEIEFGYERGEGRVVLGAAKRFKVPVAHDYGARRAPPSADRAAGATETP